MQIGVYVLVLSSGHYYIGQTGNWPQRLRNHISTLTNSIHDNSKLQQHFEDWNGFEVIEYPTSTKEEAMLLEQQMIANNWGDPLLCNIDDPNNHAGCLKGIKRSPEFREKVSAGLTGRSVSIETRDKIAASNTGYKHTLESRAKMSASRLGRTMSIETRAKMAASAQGKPKSPEAVRKSAEARGHKVVIDGVVYPSAMEAARQIGVDAVTVRNRCRSSASKFTDWHFHEVDE